MINHNNNGQEYLMVEEWRDVAGYEGYYQVSNHSRLRSLDRVVMWNGFPRKQPGKIMNNRTTRDDYITLDLCKEGKPKTFPLHRLIAIAFIPNPENKPEVNHINGIKYDNRIENLEWVTKSENRLHAYKTGLLPHLDKAFSYNKGRTGVLSHSTKFCQCTATGRVMPYQEAAKELGVNQSGFCKYMNGKSPNWTHFIPV